MAKRLNVELAFTADASQAKSQIAELQSSLAALSNGSSMGSSLGINKEITAAMTKATQLKSILAASTTKDGLLDLGKFNTNLKNSKTTIGDYAKALNALGPQGAKAFSQLAQSVSTATMSFQRANGVLGEMWTTMKNTARWQLTSSVLHGFIGGLQQAYGYAKDLNKTLTDIRIVAPEKTMEDMAQFSKLANKQAKELSATTLDYAKGALIYYQQGLEDAEVKARTDVTTKMANVTGDSTDDVSSYMTAIWNNFNKAGDESEEHFADILTKLGAETAASTTEITTSLEKYSAVAGTIGLSYEAATAAATTLIDRTRETPEVAGTALKTIFARIEGLKQEGSTDEGGTTTTLNKYSQALHNIGVEIKDQNGEMRQADQIIDDIGAKWQDLSQDQKVALAETVAGVRQWNQFAALMENFDYYKKFKDMAEFGSEGALQEQQDIYAESWEAASNRARAALEGIYQSVLDDDFFITLTNGFAKVLEAINQLTTGMGGLKTLLPILGALMMKAFGPAMADNMTRMAENMKLRTEKGREELFNLQKQANQQLRDYASDGTIAGAARDRIYEKQGEVQDKFLKKSIELESKKRKLTDAEREHAQAILDSNRALGEQYVQQAENLEETTKTAEKGKEEAATLMQGVFKQQGKDNKGYLSYAKNEAFIGEEESLKAFKEDQEKALEAKRKSGELNKLQEMLNPEQTIKELKGVRGGSQEDVSKKVSEIKGMAQQIQQEASKAGIAIDGIDEHLEGIQGAKNLDTLIQKFEQLAQAANAAGLDAQEAVDNVIASAQEAGASPEVQKSLMASFDAAEQEGAEKLNTIGAGIHYDEATGLYSQQLDDLMNKAPRVSDALIGVGNAAMQMSMAFMACQNAVRVFSDSEATFAEQLVAVLTVIGTMAPMLATLASLKGVVNAETVAGAAAAIMNATGMMTEAAAADIAAASNAGLAASFGMLWAAIWPVLAILAVLAATLGAIIILAKAHYDNTHKMVQSHEHLAESSEKATKHLNDVTSAVNNLKSSMDSIDSKRDSLRDMAQGTKEWKDAVADLNSEVQNSVKEYNELNNELNTKEEKEALNKVNEKLKEEGLKETKSLDMNLGEDYYYDSEGVMQYTASGELKLDAVQTILVNSAQITANAAEFAEKNAEVGANQENFFNEGIFGGKNYYHSQDYHDEGFIKSITGEEFSQSAYEAITKGLGEGNLTADALENTDRLTEFLEQKGVEDAASMADLITANEDLAQTLREHGDTVAANSEALKANATQDVLNDEEVNEAIFGEKSKLTQEQKDQYGTGIAQTMGGDVQSLANRYAEDTSQLYKGQDNYAKHIDEYAEAMGYQTEDNGKTFTDANGDEIKRTDISEDDVNNLMAYKKALEEVNANVDKYIDLIKDTEKDTAALKEVEKLYKENAKAIDEASESLQSEYDGLTDITDETKRTNKAWKNLTTDQKKALKDFSKNASKNLSEALDIPKDSILDPKFVGKNLDLIKDAMDGDSEALGELQKQLSHWNTKHLDEVADSLDLDIDTSKIEGQMTELDSMIQDGLLDDYQIGVEINDQEFVNNVASMSAALGGLPDDAKAAGDMIAASLGGSVEVVGYEQVPVQVTESKDSSGEATTTVSGSLPVVSADGKSVEEVPFNTTITDKNQLYTDGDGQTYLSVPKFAKTGNVPSTGGASNGGGRRGGGGGGGGCFVAGTLISTSQGFYPIEKIKQGDIVLSYNEQLQENEYNEVIDTMVHILQTDLHTIYINTDILQVTEIHPFYVKRGGTIQWLPASELCVGDFLYFASGKWYPIFKIKVERKFQVVYNFEVSGNHNYYVGKKQILAHNKGGGRRGGRRARAARHETKENKIDRYHDVTKNIDKLKRAQEKAADATEKLYGVKRIANMELVNKKLNAELNAIQKKNLLTNKYISLERTRLNQELEFYKKRKTNKDKEQWSKIGALLKGKSFQFDEFGNITNYNDIMNKLQEQRDAWIDVMNDPKSKWGKNENTQKDFQEQYLAPLDEAIDSLQGYVDAYEEELQTLLDQIDDWSDAYNEILENNFEMANHEIEFRIDLNDRSKALIDYYLDKLEDDIYKITELYNKLFVDEDSVLANIMQKTEIYTDKIYTDAFGQSQDMENYFDHYKKLYQSGQITQANYVEALQAEYDALLDNAGALNDLKEKMEDYYDNILNEVMDKLNNYIDRIDYTSEALEHLLNLMELSVDGKDYRNLINLQDKIVKQAERKYQDQLKIYQNLLNDYERAKANFEETNWENNEEGQKKAEEELNDYLNRIQEAGSEVMSAYEDMLDAAHQLLETKLEQASKDIEEVISGVTGGFEELTRQMDLSSNRQDEYLTKTNQVYEMNKLLRTLRADIDKTDNKAAKQRLGNFAKELEQLKQKDELSELELKIAEARYKQLQAQIALEEAQNAKSTVRLMRDNEGNYGYVYTANEDKVNDAQQALDDATNELYNIYLEAENDYNQKIINYASEMLAAIREVEENTDLSDADKQDRIDRIRDQYGKLIDDANNLLGIANEGLTSEFQAYSEAWSNEYTDNVDTILNNLDSGVNDWLGQIELIKNEYKKLQKQYQGAMDELVDKAVEIGDQGQEEFEEAIQEFFGPEGTMDQAFKNLQQFLTDEEKGLPGINKNLLNIETLLESLYEKMFNEAFNRGAVDSFYNYNKLLKYAQDYNEAGEMKYNSNGALNFTNSKYDFKEATAADEEMAKKIWADIELGARGWIGLDSSGRLAYEKNENGRKDKDAYEKAKSKLTTPLLKFASGGYTGDWGSEEGKIAMLHEKELVLNQQDTANMLAAVDVVRNIVEMIDMNVLSTAANISAIGVNTPNNELDQNVTITAEFPNVTDRNEIEAAFDNLVNRAAQYANRS